MDEPAINKTMDRADLSHPRCNRIVQEIFGLMRRMSAAGVSYSSWYGTLDAWPSAWEWINRGRRYQPFPGNPDEIRVPWFLLWEIAWVVANTPMSPGARVLDMGGAGSLFACYLASRGHAVVAIDLNDDLVRHTRDIARAMRWRLDAVCQDMRELTFPPASFDHVFSICVFEHLPVSGRQACSSRVRDVLRPGGTAAFTFDYANPQAFGRIDSPADVAEQLVAPSGLRPRGAMPFVDNGQRYLESPLHFGFGRFQSAVARTHAWLRGDVDRRRISDRFREYTFGAIFLENRGQGGHHAA